MAHTAYLPIIADRYGAVVRHIYVVGLDLTALDMRAQVRLYGDVPGAPLIDLRTVTNGNAEGLRLVEVTSDAGLPTSHVELVINESTMEGLPFAGEIGDVTTLAWDWQITIAGRKRRLAKGEFQITGDGVTGAEAAPTNRIAPYGLPQRPVADVWSSARMTFGEEQVTVQIDGADLVAPLAKKATDAAVRAEDSRDAAQLASATALAASRYFPTKTAGEAGSAGGQMFSTDDGAGVLIYYRRTASGSVEIGRALTPSILASGGGAKRVGFLGDGTGETLIDASTLLQTAVDVRRFGAKCDGVTDDTAAVQKALDFCTKGAQLSGSYDPEAIGNLAYPKTLLVTGMCLVSSPLVIKNRRVDRTLGRFSIVGIGQGGFVVGGNFDLFVSDEASDPLYPNSEMLVFQNLRFLSHDPVNRAYTHSGQFLRVWFEQCEWWRVACVNTTRYSQEWYFLHCMVRALSTGRAFFTSAGGYVIRSNRCKFQNFASGALGVFQLHDPDGNNGAVGCSFESDTYESSFGPYIRASICQGLTVSGLYTENNDGPLIDLRCRPVPGSRNSGVDISGNELHANAANQSNPDFYNVIWGPGGGNARGNTSKGNLHDNLKRTSGGLYVGCDVNELQADDRIVGPGRMYSLELDALDNLVPDPSARYGTFASAEMNVVTPVNGVVAHTVCLPPPVLGIRERIVVNPLNAQFTLLPSNLDDGAKFRGGAPNGGIEFPPNTARRFRVATNGVWVII